MSFLYFSKRATILGLVFLSCASIKADGNVISYTGEGAIPQGLLSDKKQYPLSAISLSNGRIEYNGEIETIGDYAFHNCKNMESITLPESVNKIGYFAFANCTNITSPILNSLIIARYPINTTGAYSIPDGTIEIASAAFRNCSIESVSIPQSIRKIGESAFAYCSQLTAITIPDEVIEIKDCAFWHCDKLSEIHVGPNPPKIEENTFGCIPKNKSILFVPEGCLQKYQSAGFWKEFPNIVEIVSNKHVIKTTITGDYSDIETFNLLARKITEPDSLIPQIIDLSQVKSIPAGNSISAKNKNTLFISNTKIQLGNETNTIVNGECASFVITDKVAFYCDQDFTALHAHYERETSNQWGTIYLPFDFYPPSGLELYALEEYDETQEVLMLKQINYLAANTPGFFLCNSRFCIDLENAVIRTNSETAGEAVANGWIMNGTYSQRIINANENSNKTYYIQNNILYRNDKTVTIPAFRAWLELQNSCYAPTRVDVFQESNPTDLGICAETVSSQATDINGNATTSFQKGGIYIINGQKIMFR